MKKLISILMVMVLFVVLCISAFALSDKSAVSNTDFNKVYGSNYGEEYALFPGYAYKSDGEKIKNDVIPSGNSIFYPIIVKDKNNTSDNDWYFATSLSDMRNINVRLSKAKGSKLIEGAEIVSKNLKGIKDSSGSEAGKIRCVEVKLNAYYGNKKEQDISYDLQLREKNSIVFDSGDYNSAVPTDFFVGQDAEEPEVDKDTDSSTGYSGKISSGLLKFTVNDNTRVVKLDEFGGKDVDDILITGGNIDFTYEVSASNQKALYLQVNSKADSDVSDKYTQEDLYFINFPGEPTFDHLGTFSWAVPDTDKKYYLYQINGKNLEEVDTRYDKDTQCLVFKTRTLGNYVISEGSKLSVKPTNSKADEDAENLTVPSTNKPIANNNGTSSGTVKPNANSSDNNVLGIMIATAVMSAIGAYSLTISKKSFK